MLLQVPGLGCVLGWESWHQQHGLTVTDDIDGNEPLLNGAPTTVELQATRDQCNR